jgi:hypothetical protein
MPSGYGVATTESSYVCRSSTHISDSTRARHAQAEKTEGQFKRQMAETGKWKIENGNCASFHFPVSSFYFPVSSFQFPFSSFHFPLFELCPLPFEF